MKDISCPSCGKKFRIDPSSYDELLSQIKDEEFNKQINERLKLAEEDKIKAIEIAKQTIKLELLKENTKNEKQIQILESQLLIAEQNKNSAIEKLKNESDIKINLLSAQVKRIKGEMETKAEIEELKLKNDLSVSLSDLEKEKQELKNTLEKIKLEKSISEKSIEDKFKEKIKERDLAIEELRDMKLKLSTKMVGETLEKHCETEFNKFRSTGFQNSYFEKDNDSKSGSKGDYIFREIDQGTEIVSIMFEMKNETESTNTKRKNEDFLKELDKDRNEKNCEYAILVSLLEPESELFNTGIVDLSYRYPKMFVIRPQFFIPIISILRNASIKSLKYKSALMIERNKNLDISNFENSLEHFKNTFNNNVKLSIDRFKDAISQIDKSINHLQKTKDALLLSEKHLLSANNKSQDLTVKRLTRNNKTMKKEFDKINSNLGN